MNRTVIAFILVVILGGYQAWSQREEAHPEGILVTQSPSQKDLPPSFRPIKYKDVVLDPLAEYSLQGRVLSTERYWIDKMAPIVPVDVALGWGVMSDSKVLNELNIWQEGRFYFYSWRGTPPAEQPLMTQQSANMHLIPSTEYVEQEIKKLRKGQVVNLRGYLVRVNYSDGSDAKSSLAREDSGAGACEIVWVQSIQTL
ncbi:hypothetical protein [Bdellovibrio sp. HCB337]|uniref:hypothetical protein n=1 Tax=Bdellovibrio sp. HCB337 TaxID=3394358 RepID=UPI0039A7479A